MLNLIVILLLLAGEAWSQSSGSSSPTFRMTGGANLASNFVEQGLTQTEQDPNLQGEFWFNFGPQFRLGLWGSNVRYDETPTTHFWLKGNADVKVDFSADSNMIIKYSQNKYFKSNDRDGNTIGVHLNLSGYQIIYETDSNWEGTGDSANYVALAKDTQMWGDYIWNLHAGYTMPSGDVSSYFDARTGLGHKLKDIFVNGSVSYATLSGDLKDRGGVQFILSASVKF